jgi:hypothetical protein
MAIWPPVLGLISLGLPKTDKLPAFVKAPMA